MSTNETPLLVATPKSVEGAIEDTYIVTLKPDSDLDEHLEWMQKQVSQHSTTSSLCEIVYKYEFLRGYAAKIGESALKNLCMRPEVQSIVQDRSGTLDSSTEA